MIFGLRFKEAGIDRGGEGMAVVRKAWGTIRKLVGLAAIHPQEAQRETGSRAGL